MKLLGNMSSLSLVLLFIFLAHGQTMVGKDQQARSMIHLLSGIDNGKTATTVESEKAARKKIETTELVAFEWWPSMEDLAGQLGMEDLAEEITAITSAIAIFIETTPVLRTLSKLVSFVLHGIAKVGYILWDIYFAIFQVWYNIQTSDYNPIFLVERQLYWILVAVIEKIMLVKENILNYELIPQDQI